MASVSVVLYSEHIYNYKELMEILLSDTAHLEKKPFVVCLNLFHLHGI